MNIYQRFVSVNGLALMMVIGVAGISAGCMVTTETPADYKQSVLAMQEQQTLNPDAKNVPGAESMLPIDGTYEMGVIDEYRGDVSTSDETRSDIDLDIDSGGSN